MGNESKSNAGSMTALELIDHGRQLVDILIDYEGAPPEEFVAVFEEHFAASTDKLGSYRYAVKRIESEEAYLKDQAAQLMKRARHLRANAARLKDRALDLLMDHEEIHGESKVSGPGYTVYLTNRETLRTPESIEDWPESWKRTKLEKDKTKAREVCEADRKAGVVLQSGFEFENVTGIAFR